MKRFIDYNTSKIIEEYKVWVIHIIMVFVTISTAFTLSVVFFKLLVWLCHM